MVVKAADRSQEWRDRLRWVKLVRDEQPVTLVHLIVRRAREEIMTPRLLLSIAALGGLGLIASFVLRPASWPEGMLQRWLRRQTPYGTPEPIVRQFLQGRGYSSSWPPGQDSLDRAIGIRFTDGRRTIQAHIGEYRSPWFLFLFETNTEAFYGFDDSSRLVDIQIRKTTDAL